MGWSRRRHQPGVRARRAVLISALATLLLAAARLEGTTEFHVNTNASGSDYDLLNGSTLTFSEAIKIANSIPIPNIDRPPGPNGRDCIDNGEKLQIFASGWQGAPGCWYLPFEETGQNAFDDIHFDTSYTISFPTTEILGMGDRIFGNGTTLDGAAGAAVGLSLNYHPGLGQSLVRDLVMRNFSVNAIRCQGCKNAHFHGLVLYDNGTGISAHSDGVSKNPDQLVIGSLADGGNTIVSNDFDGIKIDADPAFDFPADFSIVIRNNYIGDDGTLTDDGNGGDGIELVNIRFADIGGPGAGDGNFISFNNGYGVRVSGAAGDSNSIEGNFIGLDDSGFLQRGNSLGGIGLGDGASGNILRNNRIAGNGGPGIDIWQEESDGNVVHSNRIGTTANGTSARPNAGGGIRITGGADDTQIGTALLAERNLISGNSSHGVGIYNNGTTGTLVQRNWIGLNAAGTSALANSGDGVRIQEQASSNTVLYNTISGNGSNGVLIQGAGTNSNSVMNNEIGVLPASLTDLGNAAAGIAVLQGAAGTWLWRNLVAGNGSWGVRIADSGTHDNLVDSNDIGATGAANSAGGVLLHAGAGSNNRVYDNAIGWNSGNGGVQIDGAGTTLNVVFRNRIGTNAAGTTAAPNAYGVTLTNGASSNVIGGADASLGNVISGNSDYGVGVWNASTSGNEVRFNKIGTNAAVNAALPNGAAGVILALGSSSSILRDNVISGNATDGVQLRDINTTAVLERNNIGVGSNPGLSLPNLHQGVHVSDDAGLNLGTTAGTGNVIAHNGGNGVRADGTGLVAFYESEIHDNQGLAIDLGGAGVTANDLYDADIGVNGLLNMPVITSARVASANNLTARIKFHGEAFNQLRVHLFHNTQCDSTGHGEAETEAFTSATFTTDAAGNAEISMFGTALVGDSLSALVTGFFVPAITSELSTCRAAVDNASPLIFDDSFESGLYDAWSGWAP